MRASTKERLILIASLLEEGMPQKDIAAHVGISESRVSTYKSKLERLNIYDKADDELVAITLFPTRSQLAMLEEYGDPRNILMRMLIDVVEGEIHISYGSSLPQKERVDLSKLDSNTEKATPLVLEPELEAILNAAPTDRGAKGITPNTSADETPPPTACPDCNSRDIDIYKEERTWQCIACLAEDTY